MAVLNWNFFFNWQDARRGEQFEEASNCFLSIATCGRPEKYL
jgi:hypothetical protein